MWFLHTNFVRIAWLRVSVYFLAMHVCVQRFCLNIYRLCSCNTENTFVPKIELNFGTDIHISTAPCIALMLTCVMKFVFFFHVAVFLEIHCSCYTFNANKTQQQNEKVLSHNFWTAFYSSYCHVNAVYIIFFYWFYDFCALQVSLVFFSRAYYCRTKWIYIAYSSWCYTSACYMNASLRVFQRMLLIEMQYFNQIF